MSASPRNIVPFPKRPPDAPPSRFLLALSGAGLVSDLSEIALQHAAAPETPLWRIVLDCTETTEQEMCSAVATYCRVPVVKLEEEEFERSAVSLLPQQLARKFMCIPTRVEAVRRQKVLRVAVVDPTDVVMQQELEFATSHAISVVVATPAEIQTAIDREYAADAWIDDFLRNIDEAPVEIMDVQEEEVSDNGTGINAAPVVKLLNLILRQAIVAGASDVHIEPTINHMRVRSRVQGLLQETLQIPKWLHDPVISRLKILAKMDIADRRRPQDGRLRIGNDGREIDVRVSTLPTQFGEKAVLRLLGSGMRVPTVEELGLGAGDMQVLRRATMQPQGLILVTGPTGSGKTTTLYSILNGRKDPSINIITVEDPIEIQLPGINQVQVNTKAGLTFAATLRSILRQDPDVILVGEIRDLETAEIAVNAAQTGHMVFSTLHTNSTIATITRLLDLGVDPFLISASMTAVLAQRLLRTVCPKCSEPYSPSPDDLRTLHLPNHVYHRGTGCKACNNTGFAGRTAVFEILRITPVLRELIARRAPESELRAAASALGMRTLLECALDLVLAGRTTPDEVLRVLQVEEDSQPAQVEQPCPAASDPPLPARKEAAPKQEESGRPRILVVDDDPIIRAVVSSALTMLPTNPIVLQAEDGEDGIEKAFSDKPDLVITDVDMPRANGFEVVERLRKDVRTTFTPMLILTVNKDEQSRTKGYVVGTDDYMSKPFSVPEFLARVSRLLRRNYGYQ